MAHQNNLIAEARKDFVCVRIGQMNQTDLARFEFDYDTTWTSFFLDADRNVYSRYGGRDHRVADARMSPESLLQTMSEVLAVHRQIRKLPVADRPSVLRNETHPVTDPPTIPEEIPLLRENHEGCVHCHQIQEYRHLQAFHDGKFDRNQLFGYPLPESLGFQFNRKHGHLIDTITVNSAAERAGLHVGDRLHHVNGIPIRSEYDVRWALHRSKSDDPITMTVVRGASRKAADGSKEIAPGETIVDVKLQPTPNWRQTNLGWRKSLRSVPLPLGFLGYTLGSEGLKQGGFPPEKSVLKVISIRPPGLGENLKLQKNDLIVGVGGQTEFRSLDHFKSRLLELYRPGDIVKLEVIRDTQTLQLQGAFPDWFTRENSVP